MELILDRDLSGFEGSNGKEIRKETSISLGGQDKDNEKGLFLEEFPLGLVVIPRSPEANWQGSKQLDRSGSQLKHN